MNKKTLKGLLTATLIIILGCGPKGGGTPVSKTVTTAQVSPPSAQGFEHCPVGYGWGSDFNKKVVSIIADRTCNPKDRAEAAEVAGQSYMFDAMKPLLDIITQEEDESLKLSAIKALSYFNTRRVLRPFMKLIEKGEPKVRSAAAEALSYLANSGNVVAIDFMKKLANQDDEELRTIALISLGRNGNFSAREGLIKLLKHKNPTTRGDAIEALSIIGDESIVPHLIPLLEDSDLDVRMKTCYALGQIGSREATKPLINLLNDKEPSIRGAAAMALGLIGDENAIPALYEAFKKADQQDRQSYAAALGYFGTRVFDIAKELSSSDNKYLRRFGIEILGRLSDTRAAPLLIKALDDQAEDVRITSVRSLSLCGQNGVKAIIEKFPKEKSADVRIEMVRTLGYSSDSQSLPLLIKAAKEETDRVRAEAVRALVYFDDPSAEDALISALKDESEWVKESAASALGQSRVKKAISALIETLNDQDLYVKTNAARALGLLNAEEAIPGIAELLKEQNENVRQSAVSALGDIGGDKAIEKITTALSDEKESVREATINAIGMALGSSEVENITGPMISLARGLKDENFYVREASAFNISHIEIPYTKEVLESLQEEMNEADDILVNEVFWALSTTKDKKISEKMLNLFKEGNFGVLTPIEEAIANSANEETIQELKKLISGEDKYLKASSAITLSLSSSKDAEEIILPFLSSDDSFLRMIGAMALSNCGGKNSLEPLKKLLSDKDEDVVLSAIESLQKISRQTGDTGMVDSLIQLLDSPNRKISGEAAATLGIIGDERALPKLIEKFKKISIKITGIGCGYACSEISQISYAISLIGGEKAVEEMIALAKDPNPRTRQEALNVLMQIDLEKVKCPECEELIINGLKEETSLYNRDSLISFAGKIKFQKSIPNLKELMKEADRITKSKIISAIGSIGDKKEGKFIAQFLKNQARDLKYSAFNSALKLKYAGAVPQIVKLLEEKSYDLFNASILESLVDSPDKTTMIEGIAKIAKETKNKSILIYAALALAALKNEGSRGMIEKRLLKFGAPGIVFDVISYLYGDKTKGNEIFNTLREIKIGRKAGLSTDLAMIAFRLSGEEGKEYLEKLYREAKSEAIAQSAKYYLKNPQ